MTSGLFFFLNQVCTTLSLSLCTLLSFLTPPFSFCSPMQLHFCSHARHTHMILCAYTKSRNHARENAQHLHVLECLNLPNKNMSTYVYFLANNKNFLLYEQLIIYLSIICLSIIYRSIIYLSIYHLSVD